MQRHARLRRLCALLRLRHLELYALNATTGALLWKFTAGSFVIESPSVANGIVYAGSGDNNLYALDATTGALLSVYAAPGQIVSSPAIVNGAVYFGAGDGYLYALHLPGH